MVFSQCELIYFLLLTGSKTPVAQAVGDNEWVQGEFVKTVQSRGGAIIKARKLSSALSAANAITGMSRACSQPSNIMISTVA